MQVFSTAAIPTADANENTSPTHAQGLALSWVPAGGTAAVENTRVPVYTKINGGTHQQITAQLPKLT